MKNTKLKLKKGDTIIVIKGDDKGKEGEVERVYPKSNKILVKDINMVKKHMRKSEQLPQGGIIDVNRPMHASKVMLKCPHTGKRTRVRIVRDKTGSAQRASVKAENKIIT